MFYFLVFFFLVGALAALVISLGIQIYKAVQRKT